MCFSVEADVVAGAALLPVAAVSLRQVRHPREALFAALPLVFAVHQLVEAVVWAGAGGDVSPGVTEVAMYGYLAIALPLLPSLVPLAVLLLEPPGRRLRVAPFLVVGAAVSAYLTFVLVTHDVEVARHPHALDYSTGLQHGVVWAVLYVVAVIGPAVLSGYRSIVVFGVANLVGLAVVAWLLRDAFVSVWCVYAAVVSVLVLVHMLRRRRTEATRTPGGPGHVPRTPSGSRTMSVVERE